MSRGYEFLPIKCAQCQTELLRLKEAETDDRVYCPICYSWGEYERVVKQGADLIGGVFIDEETKKMIDRISSKRGQ